MLMNHITTEMCKRFPVVIHVYGDNLLKKGKAGQATIREMDNAFGIPTKRLPSMAADAFFSDQDDEFEAVENALRQLYKLSKKHQITWPLAGLGTGMAKMEEKRVFSMGCINFRHRFTTVIQLIT